MKKSLFIMVVAVSLFLFALPSAAMMGSGHESSGQSSGEPRGQPPQREPETQPSGHRHGDYFHSHEGGRLPHSHEEVRPAKEAPKSEVAPAPTKKKPAAVKPAGKTPKKTTKQAEPRHDPSRETAVSHPAEEPSTVTPPSATQPPTPPPASTPSGPLKSSLHGDDEMIMHLVRGNNAGPAIGAGDKGRGIAGIGDFYMDETHITNHQYAEFLNKVLPSVKVENGVVWGNAEIWLLLGEVKEGYEPIVFQDGKFSVKGAHHAACAVLRVTAFGALAYAHFYGKSLPTEEQWMYALSAGTAGPAGDRGTSVSSPGLSGHGEAEGHGGPAPASAPAPEAGTSLPIPSPVMLYPANELGIRGLNANVGEWGIRTVNAPIKGGQGQEEYVVLGDVSGQSAQGAPAARAIRRYPWEAFAEVGFRGAREISVSTKSVQLPGAGEVEPKPASR